MHLNKDDFNSIYKAVCDGAGSEKAKSFQYSFKNRDIAIMLLFMTTGMRKTALITLNIQDIDFDNQSIIVVDKGEIEQKYTLNDLTMKYINLWMYDRDEYTDTEALFVSKEGTRLSGTGIDKIVKKYTKEGLGIELSPHKLRAGFASILYETKHDAEFVRKAIGHSNISTTLRYITTDNKEREESSKILGNVFG
jgi:site-specific recombinase XerC